jgi:hypothetical protein
VTLTGAANARATDDHFLPDKPAGATCKSLIVLNRWLSLNQPLYQNFQMLTSRRSQAYRPPHHSSGTVIASAFSCTAHCLLAHKPESSPVLINDEAHPGGF